MPPRKTKKQTEATVEDLLVVTSIKGFDKDLSCRGHKFEVGQTYKVSGDIEACENGFHACPVDEHPLSVFEFYGPQSRFAIVGQSGDQSRKGTKLASAQITIKAEITLPQLIERAAKWVFERSKLEGPVATKDNGLATASGDQGAATASGYQGAATASGYQGAATASGYQGAATASGIRGAATASGDQGAATASGIRGAATASGYQGAAIAPGIEGRVRGDVDGVDLFAREFSCIGAEWKRISIACGTTGIDGIKAGVWYVCKDGKLVEWKD